MTSSRRRAPVILTCAAVIGLALSATTAISVLGKGAGPICGPPCLERRLADVQGEDGLLSPPRRLKARQIIREQLALSPFNTGAWLQLAALETAANGGRLNSAAVAALAASYRYAPINPEVALWRTAFVFGHWREAGEEVRIAAQREVRLLGRQDYGAFLALQSSIRDPAGSLAYRFLLGADRID